MNKSKIIAAIIIVVVIVGAGVFALMMHMPTKTTSSTTGSTNKASVPAVNNSVITTKTDATLGQYLADPNGKPLYTYNADTSGVSNCTGSCLANWPAYQVSGSTTSLPSGVSTITRADNGQKQYTYNGMPLYYFVSDSQGKVTGDGIENFTVAKPAAAASTQTPTTTPQAAPQSAPATQPSTNSSSNYQY